MVDTRMLCIDRGQAASTANMLAYNCQRQMLSLPANIQEALPTQRIESLHQVLAGHASLPYMNAQARQLPL